jgi:hypothetical protein
VGGECLRRQGRRHHRGTGYGQPPRTIASNTANQLTWNDAWSSRSRLDEHLQDRKRGAVGRRDRRRCHRGALVSARTGFLVRLNANGVPYIDYTKPLTVSVEKGVPLPQFHSILGGNVRFTDTNNSVAPLRLQSYTDRFAPNGWPAAYVFNQTLFLCGGAADWQDVDGIELHYVPIPPAFVARTDLISCCRITATACSSRAALCSRRTSPRITRQRAHQSLSHPSIKRRPKLSRLTWPRSVSRDALEQAG